MLGIFSLDAVVLPPKHKVLGSYSKSSKMQGSCIVGIFASHWVTGLRKYIEANSEQEKKKAKLWAITDYVYES